jgi:hypothetical protein
MATPLPHSREGPRATNLPSSNTRALSVAFLYILNQGLRQTYNLSIFHTNTLRMFEGKGTALAFLCLDTLTSSINESFMRSWDEGMRT